MAKYAPNCCCDRTGLCTTRWYPNGTGTFLGNPAECYVYDHGYSTVRIAYSHEGSDWYTWILGNNYISRTGLPDGADPVAAFKKKIEYTPPSGAVGESQGTGYLTILEMRTVDDGNTHAVVLGSTIITQLKDPSSFVLNMNFDFDIVQVDYAAFSSSSDLEDMADADEVAKFKIGYRVSGAATGPILETSTGGFFRCEVNQWIGDAPCGTASAQDDDSVGTVAWSGPSAVLVSDGTYALASGDSEDSHYLKYYPSLCFPEDIQSIDGVSVTITRWASDDSSTVNVKDKVVQLTATGSDNKAATSDKWPTSSGTATYGGGGDLWGLSSADLIAQGIAVQLQVHFGNNGVDAYVDAISMVVYYTDADGNPQATSPSDTKFFAPISRYEVFKNYSDRGDARLVGSGNETTYLTEAIPLNVGGSDLADLIQPYLDSRYTITGTGSLSPTTDITLTVVQDGSIDDEYAKPDGLANSLVGVAVLHAFPNEAATVHMLNNDGTITWSACGSQHGRFNGYDGIFAGGAGQWSSRRVTNIHVDRYTDTIVARGDEPDTSWTDPGSGNYPLPAFDFDGTGVDQGAYTEAGRISRFEERFFKFVDLNGYGYSQQTLGANPDLTLYKYGPDGPDAQYTLVWALNLTIAIQYWHLRDYAIAFAGFDHADDTYKAGLISFSGSLDWAVEIPSNLGAPRVNDVWTGGNEVIVAAGRGAYSFNLLDGSLIAYYPHGAICRSALRIITGDANWVALTGAGAEIDIDPADYDIDPETLT